MLLPAICLWIAITGARMRLAYDIVHSNTDHSLSDTGTTASLTTRTRLLRIFRAALSIALLRGAVAVSSISLAVPAALHPPLRVPVLYPPPIARGGPYSLHASLLRGDACRRIHGCDCT
jgi:hypothetical protein